jgi:hypothetical protein
MLSKMKAKITRVVQRALGIDDLRFRLDVIGSKLDVIGSKLDVIGSKLDVIGSKLDVIGSKLDVIGSKLDVIGSKLDVIGSKLDVIGSKLDQLDVITDRVAQLNPKLQNLTERSDSLFWQIREVSEGVGRLKSFLTWSASRVEPWLPAENFAQTEPDYDLAGFLYNFLPNRVAVEVGAADDEFAKALSGIGYQVFCFPASTETLEKLKTETANLPRVEVFDFASLSSGVLPPQIDLMKIDTGDADLEVTEGLASVHPAVVQIEFSNEDISAQGKDQLPVISASEKIKAMRDLEYYWNVILFRVNSEDFVRMATNLAGTPKQSWGKIFFFRDHQLFLKAHHWCKGALPRFRADALPSR